MGHRSIQTGEFPNDGLVGESPGLKLVDKQVHNEWVSGRVADWYMRLCRPVLEANTKSAAFSFSWVVKERKLNRSEKDHSENWGSALLPWWDESKADLV